MAKGFSKSDVIAFGKERECLDTLLCVCVCVCVCVCFYNVIVLKLEKSIIWSILYSFSEQSAGESTLTIVIVVGSSVRTHTCTHIKENQL